MLCYTISLQFYQKNKKNYFFVTLKSIVLKKKKTIHLIEIFYFILIDTVSKF